MLSIYACKLTTDTA